MVEKSKIPKIAVWGPLPPIPNSVSFYMEELVTNLRAEAEIVVFTNIAVDNNHFKPFDIPVYHYEDYPDYKKTQNHNIDLHFYNIGNY
ncbi:MAG: hypothetical protein N2D54_05120, partial [Chloroflexota bacterium]